MSKKTNGSLRSTKSRYKRQSGHGGKGMSAGGKNGGSSG